MAPCLVHCVLLRFRRCRCSGRQVLESHV
ncbi:MAG TPA: hypothetical protein DCS45_05855 [Roseovarius nubinhibens]|uniref:Invertebrate defensins family profile domain-containing protein n=1 Tax=Roseovarius nubinhibens TaxID=314263 RepID=A0A348WA27_9RHOB|nr:hypothetical protein [Roseovarius nubinhibens]